MRGLGAYYAWNSVHEPVEPIVVPGAAPSAVGAYYDWNSVHEPVIPINGLGSTAESDLADKALRARINHRPVIAVVGEWALQANDIDWRDTPKHTALTLLPLTDQDLVAVRKAAGGHEVPAVGVFRKTLRSLADQELAFVGTPYERSLSFAVYSPTDTARVAKPRFLTIATLRDLADKDRGSGSVEKAARSLAGSLVYVVSLPAPRGMRAPGAKFQEVFRQASLSGPAPAPAPPAPVAAPASGTSLWPLFLGGAAVAGGLIWLVRKSA